MSIFEIHNPKKSLTMTKTFGRRSLNLALSLIICSLFCLSGHAAGLSAKKQTAMEKSMAFFANLQSYAAAGAEQLTIKGLEESLQRKLTFKEKLTVRYYQKNGFRNAAAAPDEEELKRKNKTMGLLAMGFGILGFLLILIPVLSIASLLLWPAACVLGAIAVSRSSKFSDQTNSGFGSGLAGLILGGVGVLLILVSIVLLANAWY